ncbi:HesB/IscA family protein [Marinivivus vitaminiproducens]|uniref:HesB/IscA family protein n=1 Tax=Marinivivus vitaminiproducens TaxID=3035935 RepID=UPI0027AADD52|nr:iron-sulfur cluster assembly accessory protein [Geminicoccaceae bacterium SCSIO 64248]
MATHASVVQITPAAAARMRELLATHADESAGIKLGVKTTGCSGLSYTMDFAREPEGGAEVIEAEGVRIYVDPMAVMYLLGTEMDFVQDKLGASFVFRNPNEKSRCGCGESFNV